MLERILRCWNGYLGVGRNIYVLRGISKSWEDYLCARRNIKALGRI